MKKELAILIIFLIALQYSMSQDNNSLPIKIFLLAGQSNMDGCGIAEELPKKYKYPPEQVIVWDNKLESWVRLGETSFSKRRNLQFGPEMAFSHHLSATFPGNRIGIIKTSAGGTKLYNHWLPDSSMYERFIRNIENATKNLNKSKQSYEICGLLWMQGESDSETLKMANEYEQNLKFFIAGIRKHTKHINLPVVMGRISSSLLKDTPWGFDHCKVVQNAQELVAAQDTHVHLINTNKLSTFKDNTHFDTRGQLKLGKQMARIILIEIGNK
ncbi:sialate O-acetylesterase [Bacteroidota bacterium]